jgi:hypothetical protein
LFFKKVVEMRWFFKPQAVAYFRDIPIGVAEEGFGFAQQAVGDVVGSGFAGGFADGAVEVVYMYR